MVKDRSLSSVILDVIIHITLIFLVIVTIYPIIYILSVSISSTEAYESGMVLFLPVDVSLNAYFTIFKAGTVPNSFKNSVVYTLLYTVMALFFTTTMAYPLSRPKERVAFKSIVNKLIIFTMFFSAGMIPNYLIVQKLGMLDTMWAIVVPPILSTYNLVVMRSFFQSVPIELEEAAFLDGANELTIFYKIILPLSKAAIATVGLFYGVYMWNSWFSSMLYLEDKAKYPLQYIIRQIVMESQTAAELEASGMASTAHISPASIKYATLFVSILPMLAVYPFIQKYFVKGVMVGSVKG